MYCIILDSEESLTCLAWIMKPAESHFILSCISQTDSLFCSNFLFFTEEGRYFGWWGSSADPAAAVIQPRLCNSLELQKRDPNAFGNCEVSFPSFPGSSCGIWYEHYASFISHLRLLQEWGRYAEGLWGRVVIPGVLSEDEPKVLR